MAFYESLVSKCPSMLSTLLEADGCVLQIRISVAQVARYKARLFLRLAFATDNMWQDPRRNAQRLKMTYVDSRDKETASTFSNVLSDYYVSAQRAKVTVAFIL